MTDHLDLDALADVLAGEVAPGHLVACTACTAELDALRSADAQVRTALAALPAAPVPDDVAERIEAALARAGSSGSVTTLPSAAARRAGRWLPAAAAAVVLLAGGAFGASQLTRGDDGDRTATSASDAGPRALEKGLNLVRNSTGRDYAGRADLATAVAGLLAGTPQVAAAAPAPAAAGGATQEDSATRAGDAPAIAMTADPLAALRSDAGLAECLLALLPPEDPSVQPLALDYGSFRGTPALVVLLPGAQPRKLDVFVVGAGCSRADDSLLFYTSVDGP